MNVLAKAYVAGASGATEKFAANALMQRLAAGGNTAAQAVNRGAANPAQIAGLRQQKQQLMAQHGAVPGAPPPPPVSAPTAAQPGFMSQMAQQAIPTAMMIGAPYLINKVMGGNRASQEEP